jgi:hypothetical protein
MTDEQKTAWKELAMRWLVSQGVSTVLLIVQTTALLGGLFYGVPWARACLKEDLTAINEAHKLTVDKVIDSFEKAQERQSKMIDALIESRRLGSN